MMVLEGKVLGKKGRGRPRKKYIDDIQTRMAVDGYRQLKRIAEDRSSWMRRQGLAFR
jgi:hypothetical protein